MALNPHSVPLPGPGGFQEDDRMGFRRFGVVIFGQFFFLDHLEEPLEEGIRCGSLCKLVVELLFSSKF